MVTVMPESDVMQDVTDGRNYAIIATVLLVLALTVVAVIAVAVTLRPLEELATRMEAAAALADDGPEMAPSNFSEIESIRCQYEYMRKELTQLKSFVPQALFAKEDDEESEMAEEEERRSQMGLQSVNDGRESSGVRGTTRDGTSTAKGTAYKGDAERHTVDAKSVRSSSRASKGSIHDRPGLNLVISTTVKKATLVVFNVVGFHQKLLESSQHALSIHSQALTIVEAAVKRYKGVLDYFNGDHVFLSFNAVTTAAAHQAKAVGTAREISETLKQICNCSIGVATGELITGNIGSATSKRFCSLGATFTDALALERLCKAYDVRVLCSKAVIDHCSHEFYYRNLDVVALPSLGKDAARPVATIIGSKLGGPEDEWMYEMQRASKADVGAVINDAVERYAKGDATVLQSLVSNAEELALVNDEAVRNRLRIMASMDVQRYLQSGPSGKSIAPGM
jgi:class 3 adenylate cyclase